MLAPWASPARSYDVRVQRSLREQLGQLLLPWLGFECSNTRFERAERGDDFLNGLDHTSPMFG